MTQSSCSAVAQQAALPRRCRCCCRVLLAWTCAGSVCWPLRAHDSRGTWNAAYPAAQLQRYCLLPPLALQMLCLDAESLFTELGLGASRVPQHMQASSAAGGLTALRCTQMALTVERSPGVTAHVLLVLRLALPSPNIVRSLQLRGPAQPWFERLFDPLPMSHYSCPAPFALVRSLQLGCPDLVRAPV